MHTYTLYMRTKINKASLKAKYERQLFFPENYIIGFRWILAILAFSSYFIHFFVRNSFSVAVVAMVNISESTSDSDYTRDICFNPNQTGVPESQVILIFLKFANSSCSVCLICSLYLSHLPHLFQGYFICDLFLYM